MKCIVYISKVPTNRNGATVPTGLSEIFRVARKRNSGFKITGVLSYRHGRYIQVLEGGAKEVDQLFSNILLDSRHEQVTILLDLPITRRSFPDWNMKLLQSVNKDARFIEFMTKNTDEVYSLDPNKRQQLEHFYQLKGQRPQLKSTYDGKDLMLLAWPDFMVIKQSPVIMELCARLTRRPFSYDTLLKSGDFGTKQQLDKILNKFEILEILKITDSLEQLIKVSNMNASVGFYSKMKNFLRSR